MSPTFDNSYARLPERFHSRQLPEPVSTPGSIRVNEDLARHLGIDPHQMFIDWAGRPVSILPSGEPIAELL